MMTTKKQKSELPLEERLANMDELVAQYRVQLAETAAELKAANDRNADISKRHTETYNAGEKWKKRAEALEVEVGSLRGELHDITVEKARLEGYIDCRREGDPVPAPIMVPLDYLEQRRRARNESLYPSNKVDLTPWYKRDI